MNTALIVNTRLDSPAALERALAARLRELLGSVDWLRGVDVETLKAGTDRGFDLLAKLPLPTGGAAALCVECKREMRPSTFPMLASRVFKPGGRPKVIVPVLALPWVSPRVAELCVEHGWSWFDLAGNCRIDVPGLLHLQHSGNAPVHERPRPTANLGTKEAGRIIRVLLLPAHAGKRWTQRLLQERCEPLVSLGLVNKVVRHLRDEAFLESSEGGFLVHDPLKLLHAWRDMYRFDQQERHGYFTLLKNWGLVKAVSQVFTKTSGQLLYAGFSAATIQAPNVRQPLTWLYVHRQQITLFEKTFEAKPVDSGANVIVLIPQDDGVFANPDGGLLEDFPVACTCLPQTYVDLCHSGGRGQEAAEALLERRLKPVWKAAGLKV